MNLDRPIQLVIEDPLAVPPFRTEERVYVEPETPKSKRQKAALETALRRRARWERQS